MEAAHEFIAGIAIGAAIGCAVIGIHFTKKFRRATARAAAREIHWIQECIKEGEKYLRQCLANIEAFNALEETANLIKLAEPHIPEGHRIALEKSILKVCRAIGGDQNADDQGQPQASGQVPLPEGTSEGGPVRTEGEG